MIPQEVLRNRIANPDEFYPAAKFQAKLEQADSRYLVAVTETVTGIAHVCWGTDNTHQFVEAPNAQLRALYVEPVSWGDGIGTALLESSIERLPTLCERVLTECFAENHRARSYYESRNFDRVGERRIDVFGDDYDTTIYRRELEGDGNVSI